MRHSIPTNLRVLNRSDSSTFNAIPSFKINGGVFDIAKKKSKDYYPFLIKKIQACLPNYAQKLKLDLNLSNDDLRKAFLVPHSITFEPYVKAFQFKILNSILFTNSKLFKIGYRTDNLCSFCKRESETIRHFFWDCPYSNSFWKCIESYYFGLRKQLVHLTLKEIWIGFLSSECPLLNYLILVGNDYFLLFLNSTCKITVGITLCVIVELHVCLGVQYVCACMLCDNNCNCCTLEQQMK